MLLEAFPVMKINEHEYELGLWMRCDVLSVHLMIVSAYVERTYALQVDQRRTVDDLMGYT
jgi:hypothetical protein